MRKRLLGLLICDIVLLTVVGCANTNKDNSETDSNNVNDPYNVNNKIIEYFQTNGVDEYENYSYNYVDEENKVVIVGLVDNSKEQQDKFKELIIDSELIEFVQGKFNLEDLQINEETIDILKNTTKIKVIDSINGVTIKTVDDRNNIENIINLISNSAKLSKDVVVTSELNTWSMEMYDEDNQLIVKIYIWKSGYIGFTKAKEYSIPSDDLKSLKEIID